MAAPREWPEVFRSFQQRWMDSGAYMAEIHRSSSVDGTQLGV